MTVDFIRHTWQDWPSTETPITADELNRLEEGIAGLYSDLDGIDLANIEQTVDDLEEAVENFKAGVELTQEEYDNLTEEEKNNGTVYYITDAPSTPAISALDASYNNSTSGLQATNVQSAVDEVQGEIDELNSNINKVALIQINKTLGGGGDTNIATSEVDTAFANTTSVNKNKIKGKIVAGARPTSTWNCIPILFWNDSSGTFTVHNIGGGQDTVACCFAVFYS